MDCGIPFCHTGTLLSGMASGCPIHNLIPEWNDLVYRGLWKEALERLHKTNNFPEFTGRVCPAPCEGSCVLGINDPPVTIKNIECAIIDRAGKKAGSCPSRRSAHRQEGRRRRLRARRALRGRATQQGRPRVTVFERADRVGGLLMYGIPNMKLDKEKSCCAAIDQMEAEGVKFVTNTEVGVNYPGRTTAQGIRCRRPLHRRHQAARSARSKAATSKGIHFAMDFLTANTTSAAGRQHRTATSSPPKARM